MDVSAVNFALGFSTKKYEQVTTIGLVGVSLSFSSSGACCLTPHFSSIDSSIGLFLPTRLVLTRAPLTKPTARCPMSRNEPGIPWRRRGSDYKPTEGGHRCNSDIEDVYRMQQMCT